VITLGIDPSLTGLGWCVHNSSVAGSGRVIAKGRYKTPSSRIFYWRYMYLREAVRAVLETYPEVQAVGVESPPIGETFSLGLFGLFLYVNEAVMLHRRDVVYFDPLRVKLLAKMDANVRQGTMDKSDMVDIAKQDTGVKRWNNDEADAYIIARSAARFFDLHAGRITATDLTPAEEQVFRSVHVFSRGKHVGKTEERGILFKEGDRFYRFSGLKPDEIEIEITPDPRKGKLNV
jgi:Holliday junction resolvasome RuvABC endonuclease subunit